MSQSRAPLREVVVVGAGQVGVLAAIALKRAVPTCEVTVVAHERRPRDFADRAASGLPFTNRLHARLGIEEMAIIVSADGSHRLIERYFGWGGEDQHGALPYGQASLEGAAAFGQQWGGGSRSAQDEQAPGALAEVLADAGRFRVSDSDAGTPLGQVEYGLRWNPAAYLALLVEEAQRLGIGYRDAPVAEVVGTEGGDLDSIVLTSGEKLAADLFVDCSGNARVLVSGLSLSAFKPWCEAGQERKIVVGKPRQPMLALEDRLSLTDHGWLREFAGRDGLQLTLGIAGETDPAEACNAVAIEPVTETIIASGQLDRSWSGNVIALGDAAAEFEPIGNYHIDLAHRMIDLLLELLPGSQIEPSERAEFNRRAALQIHGVRDVVALHHAAPAAAAGVFVRPAIAPRTASQIDQFCRKGRSSFVDEQPLNTQEKQALMRALGYTPGTPPQFRSLSPTAQDTAAQAFAAQARSVLAQAPPYARWLSAQLRP